jgi:hypothetical protein
MVHTKFANEFLMNVCRIPMGNFHHQKRVIGQQTTNVQRKYSEKPTLGICPARIGPWETAPRTCCTPGRTTRPWEFGSLANWPFCCALDWNQEKLLTKLRMKRLVSCKIRKKEIHEEFARKKRVMENSDGTLCKQKATVLCGKILEL